MRKTDFNDHISTIYKKKEVLNYMLWQELRMSQDKLRIRMKAFVESQFGYCSY